MFYDSDLNFLTFKMMAVFSNEVNK